MNGPSLRYVPAWTLAGLALLLGVVAGSLVPVPDVPVPIEDGDKVLHLLAYALLMFWFAQLRVRPSARLILALGFTALGIGLEFAQGALGYRQFDPFDAGANTLGVAAGWLAAPPRTRHLFEWVESALGR